VTHTEMQIAAEIRAQMPLEEIHKEVIRVAREAAEYARSIAPVYHGDDPRATPGSYRDSIRSEEVESKKSDGFEVPMPAARVITRSPIANLLEFGTSKMPEFGVFSQTADHYGGTVEVEHGDHETGTRID
jgi:hypothetical protein